ncbi:hypothetical protein SprV_0602236000 [Sparganum proliferum]
MVKIDNPSVQSTAIVLQLSVDDERTVGQLVGTLDRPCHQHVPLVSPADEDIVQLVPVSRPRVHPGGLLSHREAEDGVRQGEPVFRAGLWTEQASVVEAIESMGTQHPSPDSTVCADEGAEVTQDSQLIRLRHRRQEGHAGPRRICFSPRQCWSSEGCVDADDGSRRSSKSKAALYYFHISPYHSAGHGTFL